MNHPMIETSAPRSARMSFPALALIACMAFVATLFPAFAEARGEAIYNVEGSAIPAGLDAGRIEKGIILGGNQRGWRVTRVADGHLLATLTIRKHVAAADIRFDTATYSITYRESVNLNAKPDGTIHRNYNKWIRNLDTDIQRALTTLSLQ